MSDQNYQDPYAPLPQNPASQQPVADSTSQQTYSGGAAPHTQSSTGYAQPASAPSAAPYAENLYGNQVGASGGYAMGARQEHPQAQTVFILGIIGIFTGVCAWIAWYMGGKAKKEIEAGAPYEWGGNLKTGYMLGKILGIIYLAAVGIWALIMILLVIFAIVAGTHS